jgi:prepilin-type N-terminal cleavage/methylation domain-containing protein
MKKIVNKKKYTGTEKDSISSKKGFSLIEVLFALLILTVGISAILVLMTSNIKNSIIAKNQIVASELAQEGVELVKNLKDNNPTFSVTIKSLDPSLAYSVGPYGAFADLSSSNNHNNDDAAKQLNLSNEGVYRPVLDGIGTPTKFFRKVLMVVNTDADGKNTTTVTALVSWNGTGFAEVCNTTNKCASVVSVLPDLE